MNNHCSARTLLPVLGALLAAGCERATPTSSPAVTGLSTFRVNVTSVSTQQPPDKTGVTEDRPLDLPLGQVELEVRVTAIDVNGKNFEDFEKPVSFRVTPGRMVDVRFGGVSTGNMLLQVVHGVGTGTVVVEKVFGKTLLWAQDAPPTPVYELPTTEDGTLADAGLQLPDAAATVDTIPRTFAAGISEPMYFAKPTIADIQRIGAGSGAKPVFDNRSSPLVGNFLTIEAPRPLGDMIVTTTTADGFFVTDLLAKPTIEGVPGTFGHIFVYNYQYPDGLYRGDRVSALTGTVQEFSGSTQIVFPSWVRVEGNPRPQDIPAPAVFDFSNPAALGYQLCKVSATRPAFADVMCAYSNNNGVIESYESGLVKISNGKPSQFFKDCDKNGNSNIPPFRTFVPDKPPPDPPGTPDFNNQFWGCDDSGADTADCECNRDCTVSQGEFTGKICSEDTNLRIYGQWVVLLNEASRTRINVSTRDALPEFDPRVFAELDGAQQLKYGQCTIDITGMLRQVQAARPRWLVIARDEGDVCVRCPSGAPVPPKIPVCPGATQ